MNPFTRIAKLAEERVNKFGAQYATFAVFGILNYPLAYLYSLHNEQKTDFISLLLRIIPSCLCLLLLFYKKWPRSTQRFLPLYWYITLVIAIPIIGAYEILLSKFSLEWIINFNIGVIILVLLVDWFSFLIIETLGIAIGVALYLMKHKVLPTLPDHEISALFFYMFFCIAILVPIFSRNKELFNIRNLKDKEQLNQELEERVSDRTVRLDKALGIKSEILNNISHEIRTPLQGVIGLTDGLVFSWPQLSEQKKLEALNLIHQSGKRLLSYLGNILDLSKFSEGKIIFIFNRTDINQLVEDMLEESKALYTKDRKLNFTASGKIIAEVDGERISQILRNLFANAAKYSSKTSELNIELHKSEDSFTLSIADRGVGIPKDELGLIFEPFTQSSKTKTKAGGTGLGLAICQEIINGHGGKIWAENAKGGGAVFSFTVPLKHNKLFSKANDESLAQKGQKHLLLVDDEEVCLTGLELILSGTSYPSRKALGGIQGLEMIRANPGNIEAVLLDIMMPGLNGFEVLKTIRKDKKLKHLKVIIQSGTSDDELIAMVKSLGINGFITKPYDREKVIEAIKSLKV